MANYKRLYNIIITIKSNIFTKSLVWQPIGGPVIESAGSKGSVIDLRSKIILPLES